MEETTLPLLRAYCNANIKEEELKRRRESLDSKERVPKKKMRGQVAESSVAPSQPKSQPQEDSDHEDFEHQDFEHDYELEQRF